MKTLEIFSEPPIIDEIDAIFHVRGKEVIYAWGSVIYNPQRIHIPPHLRAHEAVHCQRQGREEAAIRVWWDKYLHDRVFRLGEELPAHRAELGTVKNLVRDRNERVRWAHAIADRLSSAVYGGMLTKPEALKMLMS